MTKVVLNDILKSDFRETLEIQVSRKPQIWNPGTNLTRKISGPQNIFVTEIDFFIEILQKV